MKLDLTIELDAGERVEKLCHEAIGRKATQRYRRVFVIWHGKRHEVTPYDTAVSLYSRITTT